MALRPYWIECALPGRLAIVPRPRGGDWLADDVSALRDAGIDVLVSLLTAEENQELGLEREAQVSVGDGLSFISFPMPDRSVPASHDGVNNLLRELTQLLMAGKAVGIHCRACIGRSALVAACVLVEQGTIPKEAFQSISTARGCNVPDTLEQAAWVESFAARANRQ